MKLFGQHVHPPILLLATAEYGLAALAFTLAASLVLYGGLSLAAGVDPRILPWIFVFSTAVVLGITAVGLYQPKQRLRAEGVAVRLIAAIGLAVLCLALMELIVPIGPEGPLWGFSFVLSFALLGSARMAFEKLVDHEAFRRRVLVYGAGDRAASLLKLRRRSDQRGFRIAGFIPAPGDRQTLEDGRLLRASVTLLKFAQEHDVDEIVVAMDERRSGFPIRELLECRFAGIAVIDLLTFLERETGKVKVDLVNPAWLIFSEGFAGKPGRAVASRVLDIVTATLLALVSLPVMAVVAVAILFEDGQPVLYRQRRVGLWGKPFTLYKFRSMVKDAESNGAQWAGVEDPRVTRVGRIIRKLRFDELPQLFNVIRGDMSLVGPRPERPEFVSRLSQKIPYYQERHSVKPGITGWAQLSYPYGSSDEDAMEKLQYDLYYVKHRNLVFDLMVILQTVEVVVWGKGAR
jgi:sugar transferase (PEP-CTERM system associated)